MRRSLRARARRRNLCGEGRAGRNRLEHHVFDRAVDAGTALAFPDPGGLRVRTRDERCVPGALRVTHGGNDVERRAGVDVSRRRTARRQARASDTTNGRVGAGDVRTRLPHRLTAVRTRELDRRGAVETEVTAVRIRFDTDRALARGGARGGERDVVHVLEPCRLEDSKERTRRVSGDGLLQLPLTGECGDADSAAIGQHRRRARNEESRNHCGGGQTTRSAAQPARSTRHPATPHVGTPCTQPTPFGVPK